MSDTSAMSQDIMRILRIEQCEVSGEKKGSQKEIKVVNVVVKE